MGPFNYALLSNISARDAVVNFHVGIPHRFDAGRDDVQLMWDSESLHNNFYSTTNDITSTTGCAGLSNGADCANAIGLGAPQFYIDNVSWNCQGSVGEDVLRGGLKASSAALGRTYYPNSTNRTQPFINCATGFGGATASQCDQPTPAAAIRSGTTRRS